MRSERVGVGAVTELVVGGFVQVANPTNVMLVVVAVMSIIIGQVSTRLIVGLLGLTLIAPFLVEIDKAIARRHQYQAASA